MSHPYSELKIYEDQVSGRTGRQAGPDKGKASGSAFSQESLLEALIEKNFDMFSLSLTDS